MHPQNNKVTKIIRSEFSVNLPENATIIDAANFYKSELERYVVLPDGASTAVVLWDIATYLFQEFNIFPRIVVSSPQKRCGKTTLLQFVGGLALNGEFYSKTSTASLYRGDEIDVQTMAIDEADRFIKDDDNNMIGIINSGHSKHGGKVGVTNTTTFKREAHGVYFPMAFGTIKPLSGTIMDRSIGIPLRRKTQQESVEKFDENVKNTFAPVIDIFAKFADEIRESVRECIYSPQVIKNNDRARDNWIPLFTIAQNISEDWAELCWEAYVALTPESGDDDIEIQLLRDIREVLKKETEVRISSAALVTELNNDKDRPWCEFNKGRPLSPKILANILSQYGIFPKHDRYKGKILRCYEISLFQESFERYL